MIHKAALIFCLFACAWLQPASIKADTESEIAEMTQRVRHHINALGRIKFIFPNRFAVYLHDTPQRSQFNFTQRDFSSGCIRLENAQVLAAYLLKDKSGQGSETIAPILSRGKRRVVRIPNPIPVHLIYMTAWVDHNGRLQFRNDIYRRDRALNAALKQRPPDPPPPLAAVDEPGCLFGNGTLPAAHRPCIQMDEGFDGIKLVKQAQVDGMHLTGTVISKIS
jgi:hypothetical protein